MGSGDWPYIYFFEERFPFFIEGELSLGNLWLGDKIQIFFLLEEILHGDLRLGRQAEGLTIGFESYFAKSAIC